MDSSKSGLVSRSAAVLAKDLRLEFRSRHAINSVFLFSVSTLAVISFSIGQAGLGAHLLAALYWVILFFSAMAGLAHVFVREEETGTAITLRLTADPEPVYLGKLFFNLCLLSLLVIIITPLFFIFTDLPGSLHLALFLVVSFLGVIALAGATTLVAAIIARASARGALFSVLSFPVIVPLLLVLVAASRNALEGATFGDCSAELQFLVAYLVAMIVGSLMLFRFVWND